MLTRTDIYTLGGFEAAPFLAVSLYLALDPGPQPHYLVIAKDLLRQAEDDLSGRGVERNLLDMALRDFQRLLSHLLDTRPDRVDVGESARGFAGFACEGKDLFRTMTVPVQLPNRIVCDDTLYVRPLKALLESHRRINLTLIDRRKARMFDIYLGEVTERKVVVHDVPSKVREGGWAGYSGPGIARHVEDHVHRHMEAVAARLLAMLEAREYDWLVLGGPPEDVAEFAGSLHPYVRERLRTTVNLPLYAPEADVAAAGREIEVFLKRQHDLELLARVREGLFPGGWAVSGLDETLSLLAEGRVRTFLVRAGYQQPGVLCPRGHLLPKEAVREGKGCPYGCGRGRKVADVLDEAVVMALDEGAEVAHVDSPEMERLGNAAALLRYR